MDKQDIFIKNIKIGKVRNLQDIDISISETEKKHLILTGKNGSGKTSLLESMRDYFGRNFLNNHSIRLSFNMQLNEFLSVYIPAKRSLNMDVPKSIEKVDVNSNLSIDSDLSRDFLKYIIFSSIKLLPPINLMIFLPRPIF